MTPHFNLGERKIQGEFTALEMGRDRASVSSNQRLKVMSSVQLSLHLVGEIWDRIVVVVGVNPKCMHTIPRKTYLPDAGI